MLGFAASTKPRRPHRPIGRRKSAWPAPDGRPSEPDGTAGGEGGGHLRAVVAHCFRTVVFIEATAAVHHGCAPYLPLQFFFKKVRTCPKWTELVVVQYRFDVNNTFRMCFGTLTWRTSVNVRADLNHQISQKEKTGKMYLTRLLGNGLDQALHFSCNGIEPEHVDSW